MKLLSNFDQSTTETILKDSSEFNNTLAAPHKDLNYIINSEKRVTYIFKILTNKNGISEETYYKLRQPGTPHGSAKVHNPFEDGLPPFTPIISAIGTSTY